MNNLAENGDCGWRVLRTGLRVRLFGTVLDVRCEDERRVGLRFKHLSGIDGCWGVTDRNGSRSSY